MAKPKSYPALRAETGADLSSLLELVQPWAAGAEHSIPRHGLGGPYNWQVWVAVTPEATAAETPRELRAALMATAEDGLAAIEAAGWFFTEYPQMEFTGNVQLPCFGWPGNQIVTPGQQCMIALKVSFSVDRVR